MTNYPQRPNIDSARAPQGPGQRGPANPEASVDSGIGQNPLADPSVRMVLSMSPQDGSIKPLPANLEFVEQANGSVRVSFPDGSVRELIPGASGEGRMITTLSDGTRIQSDLTFGEGRVSVSSISSTGEKTLLSLNENGANMQRVTADGQVSSFIPDSAPELIQSYREAEEFAQAEELRQQEEFQGNQEFGEWNNYGKPADWQPEQNWQPPQGNWQPPQGDYFPKPDYAGNNWVDNGNGSWIAPIQPDAFQQPMGYVPPQQFGEWNNYGKPADWQPEQNWQPPQGNWQPPQGDYFPQPMAYQPPQGNWQPPQGDYFPQPMAYQPPQGNWQPPQGDYFPKPDYAGNNWVDNGNGSWIAPIQPDAFQQPMAYQPPQGNWQPPQFDQGFQQPMAYQPPQGNWQPPQFGNAQGFADPSGFPPPPFKDASGFPISTESSIAPATATHARFDQGATASEMSSGDGADFDTAADQDQIPNQ